MFKKSVSAYVMKVPKILFNQYKRLYDNETYTRSATKSFLWRITGIFILAIVSYYYTQKIIITSLITFIHHFTFLLVFFVHERIWLKIKWPVTLTCRSIAKMLTYETLCGNIILGIITYVITGNWKSMTKITITYITIKHVLYIANEFIWKKIDWGYDVIDS